MVLLFTLTPNNKCNKDSLIFCYDTKLNKGSYIDFADINTREEFLGSSGIVYSGNYLCFGIHTQFKTDKFLIFDIFSYDTALFKCSIAKNIGSIISIYPGKLYLDSVDTNSIVCIDFDTVNLSYFEDSVYYVINGKPKLKSLCNYNNNWFVALQEYKKIYDLTNDRIVYSDIELPNNLFFNNNHRLCFLETNRGLFHCGDDIFHVGDKPTSAIEDLSKGGYWIADGSSLLFISYDGDISNHVDLSEWNIKTINNIVEAKGIYETILSST